ncbi:MAG: hypothetical protein ACI8RA_002290, partial [Chlamydiales bacterium]
MSSWDNGFQGASNPPFYPNGLWGAQNTTQNHPNDVMGEDDLDENDVEMMSVDEISNELDLNDGFNPPLGLFSTIPIPIPGNENNGNTGFQNPFRANPFEGRAWGANPVNQGSAPFGESIRNLIGNEPLVQNREFFFATRTVQLYPPGENPPQMPVFDLSRNNFENRVEPDLLNTQWNNNGTFVFPPSSTDFFSQDFNELLLATPDISPDYQQISEILEPFNGLGDFQFFDAEEPQVSVPSVVQLYSDDPQPPYYRSSYISPIAQALRDEEEDEEIFNIDYNPQRFDFSELSDSEIEEPVLRINSPLLDKGYSPLVEERKEIRGALELSEQLEGGIEPGKYTHLLLPSDLELAEAKLNGEHLRCRIVRNEIHDVPVDSNFIDFMGLFENAGILDELPDSIIDEDFNYAREEYISRFEQRLGPIYNGSPNSLSGSSQGQVEGIRKTLKHLYLKLSDELANIQLLEGGHQRNAFEEFKSKIKRYFLELTHGALHCNDRIAQESELVYGEEFRGLNLSISSTLSVEDKILNHLQSYRDQLFRQVVAEIPRRFPRYSQMDIATNVQHFQEALGEEFNLSMSTGTIYSAFVCSDAEGIIRSEFNTNYTVPNLLKYLRGNCNFGDLYKWFEERYDVENLGSQISNENV